MNCIFARQWNKITQIIWFEFEYIVALIPPMIQQPSIDPFSPNALAVEKSA